MKILNVAATSLVLSAIIVLSGRIIGRQLDESNQEKKAFEICAVITSEVQTGSMSKAIENAKSLFSIAFPSTPTSIQVRERNILYGVGPSSTESERYRTVTCSIEARSDASVTFFLLKKYILDRSLVLLIAGTSVLILLFSLGLLWIAKKITVISQKRFNQELQIALGLSPEPATSSFVSQILERIVQGVGGGKNLKESVQNLREKIIEQNSEALRLREIQMTTDIELKKNEKFVEVVRQVRHDIRSPLHALTVLTEKSIDPALAQRQMTSVISSIHGMIEDLEIKEEMADSSGSGERLHVAEALIKEVIQQKRLVFGTTAIELKINSDFLSVVRVQPHHFRRAIGNILQNAYEAIVQNKDHGLIRIETEKTDDRVLIHIHDNGGGIPAAIQDKIFVAGFTHGKENGSGLGLSHAKSCFVRWGGEINMDCIEGEGTTVAISLPIHAKEALFVAQPPLLDIRVNVVVDDHPADFERVQRVLTAPAVYCSSLSDFANWQAAVQDQDGVQFIFDYNLGESITGLHALKTVQSSLPRILSTNDYDHPDVIESSMQGIYVLPKIFLVDRLRSILDQDTGLKSAEHESVVY